MVQGPPPQQYPPQGYPQVRTFIFAVRACCQAAAVVPALGFLEYLINAPFMQGYPGAPQVYIHTYSALPF